MRTPERSSRLCRERSRSELPAARSAAIAWSSVRRAWRLRRQLRGSAARPSVWGVRESPFLRSPLAGEAPRRSRGRADACKRLRRPAAQPPPAAEGGWLLPDQAKARQARQAQARPSQGKAQQASQPSQGDVPMFRTHRHMVGKLCRSMKSGMKQLQVPPFDPKT